MITLSELYRYPLKSAAGTSVNSVNIDAFGVAGDRRYMVVDPAGCFMTQRRHPKMALIGATLDAEGVTLSYPGCGAITVRAPEPGAASTVEIWGESVAGHDVGDEAATWLSACLNTPCRLVYMRDETCRPVDPNFTPQAAQVSFADGFPLLLIGQASLDDLNARLDLPVDMRRFRPNLVVTGSAPFEEDTWKRIRIGDICFDLVKPCARCVMTTVDPVSGVKGKEPMRTLATYRSVNGSVLFGQNLVHRGRGSLEVGQSLEVLM